jgi:hypothetical protein
VRLKFVLTIISDAPNYDNMCKVCLGVVMQWQYLKMKGPQGRFILSFPFPSCMVFLSS